MNRPHFLIPWGLVSVLLVAAASPSEAQTLCVKARRGSLYAVGEGYAQQSCRPGDQPYLPPATQRGLRSCVVDATPGTTSMAACSCEPGEVVEMAGPLSASPEDLVYDLHITPAGSWDGADAEDYRTVLTEISSDRSGSVTIALRCAAQ